MDDKKLLELAAKACGGLVYVQDMGWIHEDAQGNRGNWWNPLGDDGAALRLAIDLSIEVTPYTNFEMGKSKTKVNITDVRNMRNDFDAGKSEIHGSDRYSATRRAIVRAAAEIGKNLG